MKYEKYKDLYTQFLISEKNLSKNSLNNYLVDLDQFFFDQASNPSNINIKIKLYNHYMAHIHLNILKAGIWHSPRTSI